MESVASQQFRDFELIIVDDGSEDGTKELVNYWKNGSNNNIRYFRQANQGKHSDVKFRRRNKNPDGSQKKNEN